MDGIVYIESDEQGNVKENILRHEVFHKIFNQYLTMSQRESMLELAEAKFGKLSRIELEEALARDYQTFKIPLLKRFISFTFRHKNTLDAMYVAMDKALFRTEYNKFFGQRNAIKIEKDFQTIQNFRIAEEEFFSIFNSLVNPTDETPIIYTFEEAIDQLFLQVDNEIDYWKKELPNAATPEYKAEVEESLHTLLLIKKNKDSLLDLFFTGWDQSKVKAKERLQIGQFKLNSILGKVDTTEEEKEEAEEKFNTLRQEIEDSLQVDPKTALTARVKYRLAGLTYQSIKGDKTPIPFYKSFSILLRSLNQADTSSIEALVKHLDKTFAKYVTAKAEPQSAQEAVIVMLKDLALKLKSPSKVYSFRRDISRNALYLVDVDGEFVAQQEKGELLHQFMSRVSKDNADYNELVKAYKFFDSFITAASLSSAVAAQRPYKMWRSQLKYDTKNNKMVLKFLRNRGSGGNAVERSNITNKIKSNWEQGNNPYDIVDNLGKNLIQLAKDKRDFSLEEPYSKNAVDYFIESMGISTAGLKFTPSQYAEVAKSLYYAREKFNKAMNYEEVEGLATKAIKTIVDVVTDFSSIPESLAMTAADKTRRYSFTMSTYQHTILNFFATRSQLSKKDKVTDTTGILPPHLQLDDKGNVVSSATMYANNMYLGETPLVEIKDYVDWDAQEMPGNKAPVDYLKETEAEWWQRTFVIGFLKSVASKGLYTHWLPVPSNRSNITGVQVTLKSVKDIKEKILPLLLKQEQSRPPMPEVDDKAYFQHRLTLPTGSGVKEAKDATVQDIIAGLDKEVERIKELIDTLDLRTDNFEDLQEATRKTLSKVGITYTKLEDVHDTDDDFKEQAIDEVKEHLKDALTDFEISEYLATEEGQKDVENATERLKATYAIPVEGSKQSKKQINLADAKRAAMKQAVEVFVYNNIVNQHQLVQLLYADSSFFPNAASLIKRIQGPTSSGTVPLIAPEIGGLPQKTGVAILKDVKIDIAKEFEKMVDLPADSPVRKQLESVVDAMTETDSQGFTLPEYFEQLNMSFSPESGLDVVQKFMYYAHDDQGIPRFIKYSSILLTDEICKAFPHFGKIRASMHKHNATTKDAKVGMAVFASGIKLAKPAKLTDVSEDLDEVVVEPGSVFSIDNRFLRMPLNPASDILKTTAVPGQGNYLLNANSLNVEEMNRLYKALEVIIDSGEKIATKDVQLNDKGKPTRKTLTLIRKQVLQAVKGLSGAELEEMLLESEDKYGYTISSSLPILKSRVLKSILVRFAKATSKIRFRGSKLVLQSEFGTRKKAGASGAFDFMEELAKQLKYKDKNGYTEVIMPDTFKGKFSEGQILGFRIPSTHLHSFIALKVVGFYPVPEGAHGNVVIAPSMIQFASGCDYDVDSLFTIQYDINDNPGSSLAFRVRKYLPDFPLVNLGEYFSFNDIIDYEGKRTVADAFKSITPKIESILRAARKEADRDFDKLRELDQLHLDLLETLGAMYKNEYISIYVGAIAAQKNMKDNLTPIGFGRFKNIEEEGTGKPASVFQVLASMFHKLDTDYASKEQVESFTDRGGNVFLPTTQQVIHENTAKGASLTGNFANSAKALAMLLYDKAELLAGQAYAVAINGTNYNGLSRTEKGTGVNIFHTIDTLINAAIDNVKEEILYHMNISTKNSNQFIASIGMGIPLNDVVKLFAHPLIIELGKYRSYELDKPFFSKELNRKVDLRTYKPKEGLSFNVDVDKVVESTKLGGPLKSGIPLDAETEYGLLSYYYVASNLGDVLFTAVNALSILTAPPTTAVDLGNVLDTWSKIVQMDVDTPEAEDTPSLKAVKEVKELRVKLEELKELHDAQLLIEKPTTEEKATIDATASLLGAVGADLKAKMTQLAEIGEAAHTAESFVAIANSLSRKGHTDLQMKAAKTWPFKDNFLAAIPHVRRILMSLIKVQSLLESVVWTSRKEFDYVAKKIQKDLQMWSVNKAETREEIKHDFYRFLTSNLTFRIPGDNTTITTKISPPEDLEELKTSFVDKNGRTQTSYRSPQSKWVADFVDKIIDLKEQLPDNDLIKALEYNSRQGLALVADKGTNPVYLAELRQAFKDLASVRYPGELDRTRTKYSQLQADFFKYALIKDGLGFEKTTLSFIFPEDFYIGFSREMEARLRTIFDHTYSGYGFAQANLVYDLFKFQYIRNNYDKLGYVHYYMKIEEEYKDADGNYYDAVYEGKTPNFFKENSKPFFAAKYDEKADRTYAILIPSTSTPYYEFDYAVLDKGFNMKDALGAGANRIPVLYTTHPNDDAAVSEVPYPVDSLIFVAHKSEAYPQARRLVRVTGSTKRETLKIKKVRTEYVLQLEDVGVINNENTEAMSAIEHFLKQRKDWGMSSTEMSSTGMLKLAGARNFLLMVPTTEASNPYKGLRVDQELIAKSSESFFNIKPLVVYGIPSETAIQNIDDYFESIKDDRKVLLFDKDKLYALSSKEGYQLSPDVTNHILKKLKDDRGYESGTIDTTETTPLEEIPDC